MRFPKANFAIYICIYILLLEEGMGDQGGEWGGGGCGAGCISYKTTGLPSSEGREREREKLCVKGDG